MKKRLLFCFAVASFSIINNNSLIIKIFIRLLACIVISLDYMGELSAHIFGWTILKSNTVSLRL